MSGYHFFVETGGGQWHRTEDKGEPGETPVKCACGISNQDPRVLKHRDSNDDSWQWVPESQLGRCFPAQMRKGNAPEWPQLKAVLPVIAPAVDPLEAAVARDHAHPTRVAYERARAAHPSGGEEARAAFHRFLVEEKIKRDAGVDRRGPKAPNIDEKTGVPFCSMTSCPKYAKFQHRCTETGLDDPTICEPAVRDMALELDARKDAADPAFDEIVKLCGLAKTWEYPGQVVRDVEDALKKRDERIATLETVVDQNAKLQAALKYARDRRGGSFDFDEWKTQVEHALDNKIPPHAIENAQAKEAQAWAAVEAIRKDRDEQRGIRLSLTAAVEAIRKDRDEQRGIRLSLTADRDLWKRRATTEWSKGPYGGVDDPGAARVDAIGNVATIRSLRVLLASTDEERTKDLHAMTAQGRVIDELRERLRVAEAVRDDARTASQRYLDAKREVEERLRKAVVDWRLEVDKIDTEKRAIETAGSELTELTELIARLAPASFVPGHGKYDPAAPLYDRLMTYIEPDDDMEDHGTIRLLMTEAAQALHAITGCSNPACVCGGRALHPHSRECGTAYRGCAPDCAFAAAQQCPWVLPDGDPDEGYWHCKLPDRHEERHITEFGRGLDERWYRPCEGDEHTFVGDCCRECGYPVPVDANAREMARAVGNEDVHWNNPVLAVACPRCKVPRGELCDEKVSATWSTGMAHVERANLIGADLKPKPDQTIAPTHPCGCSPKYRELNPGIHAKYCALAGLPLGDGHKRWHCRACGLTFHQRDSALPDPDKCMRCGQAALDPVGGPNGSV